MEGVGLTLLGGTLVARVGKLLQWRPHTRSLPIVVRDVRCPLHDCQAVVNVRTAPDAPARRQYVDVAGCSLLSDAAIGLPEQRAYLPDAPACSVLLEPASAHPVYAADVSCSQRCVGVLNAAAGSVPPRTLECASGTSDAIDLMRQADPRCRLLGCSGTARSEAQILGRCAATTSASMRPHVRQRPTWL